MFKLTSTNILAYLREQGYLEPGEVATAQELAWGVSNVVIRISRQEGPDWVIKQSRAQLRTIDPWFSQLDRIWREVETLRVIQDLLPVGVVPAVLFEDRDNYWFAMQAVDTDHVVWKQALLQGQVDTDTPFQLGHYLGTIHHLTHSNPALTESLQDRTVFEELRVDPFYTKLAKRYPDMKPALESMISEMLVTPACLVLGDFSPKNILITDGGITLVDFETGHRGDPAFDLGFFLSHLLLKTVLKATRFQEYADLTRKFWSGYLEETREIDEGPMQSEDLLRRTVAHLAGCMWARIDATSPVDYLSEESQHNIVRDYCSSLLLDPPDTWNSVLQRLENAL